MNKFKYTLDHRKAFLQVEKQLLGRNTLRGLFHDLDKLVLYIFLDKYKAHIIHRKFSKHHVNDKYKSKNDYIEMVIDWECARYTKPDKPLNAKETLERYYPQLENAILPILKELRLD